MSYRIFTLPSQFPYFLGDSVLAKFYFDELPITYKNQGKINLIRKILNDKVFNFDINFVMHYIWKSPNMRDYKITMDIEEYMNKIAYKFSVGGYNNDNL